METHNFIPPKSWSWSVWRPWMEDWSTSPFCTLWSSKECFDGSSDWAMVGHLLGLQKYTGINLDQSANDIFDNTHAAIVTCLSHICNGLLPMLYNIDRKPLWNVFLNILNVFVYFSNSTATTPVEVNESHKIERKSLRNIKRSNDAEPNEIILFLIYVVCYRFSQWRPTV